MKDLAMFLGAADVLAAQQDEVVAAYGRQLQDYCVNKALWLTQTETIFRDLAIANALAVDWPPLNQLKERYNEVRFD